MSDLYNALYAVLKPNRFLKKHDDPPPKERWGVGMAFEEMLEEGLARRVQSTDVAETIYRPGEFETLHTADCPRVKARQTPGCGCVCGGGIYYSPDLLIEREGQQTRLGEIKLNTMSAKGIPWKVGESFEAFDPKYDKILTQMKCYCYHLNTTLGRLYNFSVREMVNFNEPAIFRAWDITFTPQELEDEWAWVLRHAQQERLVSA